VPFENTGVQKENTMKKCIIIVSLFICGCSGISGKLHIIEGNYHHSREKYADAITSYMKAFEYSEAAPYAEYGLGLAYFAVGEEKAAITRYAEVRNLLDVQPTLHRELRYRVHYNTGVALFSEGNYSAAADSFREALRADGRKVEAKRNLELSLKSHARESASGSAPDGGENSERDESVDILFEYIRQKEVNQWKSREWPEEDAVSGPDY
jgi:Ca-activated chloride channel family protein